MEGNRLGILKETADNVYLAVSPLLRTEISNEAVGVGASGDTTRKIDGLAEEVIIQHLEKNQISCVLVGEECALMSMLEENCVLPISPPPC